MAIGNTPPPSPPHTTTHPLGAHSAKPATSSASKLKDKPQSHTTVSRLRLLSRPRSRNMYYDSDDKCCAPLPTDSDDEDQTLIDTDPST